LSKLAGLVFRGRAGAGEARRWAAQAKGQHKSQTIEKGALSNAEH
jgi:hypothetical protein